MEGRAKIARLQSSCVLFETTDSRASSSLNHIVFPSMSVVRCINLTMTEASVLLDLWYRLCSVPSDISTKASLSLSSPLNKRMDERASAEVTNVVTLQYSPLSLAREVFSVTLQKHSQREAADFLGIQARAVAVALPVIFGVATISPLSAPTSCSILSAILR